MCGIGGVVSFRVPPRALRERALTIQRRLRHRGPDGQGDALTDHAALVHTRLILRDAQAGGQPMRSPDGRLTLTFNGELYNLDELGAPSRTFASEAEALLTCWAAHGPAGLSRLNGMFAFFVWDQQAQEGYLVRDRLGIKPAAYRWDGETLAFASEAHALLGASPRADLPTVLEYLTAPCFSGVEHSAFEGVDYLPPGHWLRVSAAGVTLQRWAAPPAVTTLQQSPRPDPALVAELHEALPAAITRALIADAPVGVFLSGGLDSTVLAACARAGEPPCFSVAFEDQAAFPYGESAIVVSDDAPFVTLARKELGLRGHDVFVARRNLAAELKALAVVNDALPAWEQELAQYHLAAAARPHVKAVLVGDAADETHYGYHFLLDEEALSGPEVILRRLGSVPLRRGWFADPVAHFGQRYRDLVASLGGVWGDRDQRVLATTLLIQTRWLPRLLHNGDIHTMHHSLEARVPFADSGLLELAARVPPSLGLRDGVEKFALREACRGLVPEAIRARRKSALPKDQGAGDVYRQLVTEIVRDPPALVAALVDLDTLATWLTPQRPLLERERAALFRVIGLANWARHHGVAA